MRNAKSRAASRDRGETAVALTQLLTSSASLHATAAAACSLSDKTASVRDAVYAIADGASYLSIDQVSRVLGIADQTVRNQISAGVFAIPSIKIGRRRLLATETVIAFVLRSDA